MIIKDIKFIDKIENELKSPYKYRCRLMKITTDRGSFFTPARVTTRSEHIARSMLPLSRTVPLELALDFRELDNNQVANLNNDDGKVGSRLIRVTKQYNDITDYALLRFSVFQPPNSMLKVMSSKSKIEFAISQADFLQSKLGSSVITYPFLHLPLSEYKEFIDRRYQSDENASTIFFFDMVSDSDYLRNLIDHIIQKEQPSIIGLRYRNWEETIPQHRVVASYIENDRTAFIAAQVEREQKESHVSNLQSVAFGWGLDLVSLIQQRGHSEKQKLDLSKIRVFNPKTWMIDGIETTLGESERNLVEEFDIPTDNTYDTEYMTKILGGYMGARIHPKKFQTLFYLARTHEAISSPKVFDELRRKIPIKEELENLINQTGLKFVPMLRNLQST